MARRRGKTRKAKAVPVVADCNSEVVQRRLNRIEENYEILDDLLSDLESKVPSEFVDSLNEADPKKPR